MTLVIAAGGGVYGVLCADDVRAGREIKIYIIKIKEAARRGAHRSAEHTTQTMRAVSRPKREKEMLLLHLSRNLAHLRLTIIQRAPHLHFNVV
jgi:hypothetical protein